MDQTKLPTRVGKYEIEGLLGRGAMGVVYRGRDPVIDRPVAIKIMRADLLDHSDGDEFRQRFRREAQAAGRCAHPNIVAIFDYSEVDGLPYLVMELIEGRELKQALEAKVPVPAERAVAVIRQVLAGLGYAHGMRITHRDIKPANIMILDGGLVKIADFGVARVDSSDITQQGAVVGTPSYMSPEQFTGQEVDHRADLFGVGVVLFELLAGEKPFPGRSTTDVMYRLLNHEPRDLTEINAAVPAGFNTVIRRALAKDRSQRYQSAAEFAADLDLALHGRLAPPPPAEATVIVAPPPPPATAAASPGSSSTGSSATGSGSLSGASQSASASGTTSGLGLPPATAAAVEQALAYAIGPIAKIMLRKALQKGLSGEELLDSLARNIDRQADRTAFLDKARRALSTAG